MAGPQVGVQQQRVPVALEGPELRDVLGRFPVHDLAVVERGPDQHRRIPARCQIAVRTVGPDPPILGLDRRVAPFLILADGERQRRVEHGVDHIQKRDLQQGSPADVRTEIEHRADQEPPRAPALDRQTGPVAPARGHEVVGGGDEIGEGVHLLAHPAGVVPGPAHLAPAPDVGHREGHAAIEEAQPVRGERNRVGNGVRAVPGEIGRHRARSRPIPAPDERHRNQGPIRRAGKDPLALVPPRVVVSQDCLPFEQYRLAGRHVVVVDR